MNNVSTHDRLRIRHHMLVTKPGELTPGELYWLRHLEQLLGITKESL